MGAEDGPLTNPPARHKPKPHLFGECPHLGLADGPLAGVVRARGSPWGAETYGAPRSRRTRFDTGSPPHRDAISRSTAILERALPKP